MAWLGTNLDTAEFRHAAFPEDKVDVSFKQGQYNEQDNLKKLHLYVFLWPSSYHRVQILQQCAVVNKLS